ncbi:MAG: hypothetical protein R2688_08960 [Fimbriimonadaceae bacterium]
MKRFAFAALFAAACTSAFADRIVFIPTGRKVNDKNVRFDVLGQPSRDNAFGWFTVGLMNTWEFELYGENLNTDHLDMGANVAYNLIQPLTDLGPGVSFGILDLGDNTSNRRTGYVAVTYRLGNVAPINQDIPTDFSFGLWTRDEGVFFAGMEIPFSKEFRLLAEHDSRFITAGIELKPVEEASLRFLFRDGSPMVGLKFQKRF